MHNAYGVHDNPFQNVAHYNDNHVARSWHLHMGTSRSVLGLDPMALPEGTVIEAPKYRNGSIAQT
jgi:hypothetical protein